MGVGLNTMLAAVGAGGVAASKVSSSFNGANDKNNDNLNTKELKAQLAEVKSNQGIIDEYSTIKTNLSRAKNLPTWNEKKEKELAFAEAMIERFSKANDDIMGKMKDTLSKKTGGSK